MPEDINTKPGFRVTAVHVFTLIDDDDEEGVPAFRGKDGMIYPLIAADENRLANMRPIAEELAKTHGKVVKLSRFTVREDLEEFQP